MCDLCAMTYRDPEVPVVAGYSCDETFTPGADADFAVINEGVDASASTSTSYTINVGDSFNGTLTSGDQDWVRVTLQAGTTYNIAMNANTAGLDPYLRVHNSSGTQIAFNDDGGDGYNSFLSFTATTTGTYYLNAGSWNNGSTGNYTLSITAPPPLPVFDNDQIAAQLTDGYWEATGRSQRSFNVSSGGTLNVNITGLTAEGQFLATQALAAWTAVTGINFNFVSGSAAIMIDDNDSGAYNSSTTSGNTILSSTVNVSTAWLANSGTTIDSYSFQTYLHEIGHALGLGHAGNYNSSATYGIDNHYRNDSWQGTVMSYFDQVENTYINATRAYIITPMVADIIAIQNLYGASTTTNLGNTVYGSTGANNTGTYVDNFLNYGNNVAITVYDSGGFDTLNFSNITADQLIDLRQESYSNVGGFTGNLTIARGTVIEEAVGGSGNDTLIGNDASNHLNGGAGADTMIGGRGNDYYYIDNVADVVVELAGEGDNDWVVSTISFALWQNGQNVENLALVGSGNIDGTGNALNNEIRGNSGNNVLNGGQGADRMIGGAGNDTYHVDNVGDTVVENAGEGIDTVISSVSYTLWQQSQHIENLRLIGTANINATGNGLANTLTGNSGNNVLDGAGGADTMIGGAGNDSYSVNHVGDVVVELAGEGIDTVFSSVSYQLWQQGQHIENLTLIGSANLNAVGNSLNNVLTGNSGNNVLNGGQGADTMIGGAGNDTYHVDNVGDTVVETAGQGIDTVISSVSYELWQQGQHIENLTLIGSANLNAVGNSLNNVLTGNSGNNVLNGGAGADTMIGGAGNDTYHVDNVGDTIVETAGQGIDTVISSVNFALWQHGQHVEHLTLIGTGNISGVGNARANAIRGNSGDNWIDGSVGNDYLTGGAGADTFAFLAAGDTDTITDFEHGIDTIRIGVGASNFSQVTVTDVGADTHLTFGSNTIILQNFDHTLISAGDFSFV